jgi:GNAT superfamily N-acetyltransferase
VLTTHLTSGNGFVLVAGEPIRGMISGIMFEDMSTGELCCMEFFWFVDPNERGSIGIRLLDALESEARKRGAVRVLMAHLASEKTAKFEKLYERRGYELKEQVFYKVVKPCAE